MHRFGGGAHAVRVERETKIVVRRGEHHAAPVDGARRRRTVHLHQRAQHVTVVPRQRLGSDSSFKEVHRLPTSRSTSLAMSAIVRISARSLRGNEMSYVSSSCSTSSMISIEDKPTSSTRSLSSSTTVPSSASWLTSSFKRAA